MSLLEDLTTESAGTPRRRSQLRKAIIGLLVCCALLALVPAGVILYVEHRLSANVGRIPGVFDGLENRPSKPLGAAGAAVNVLVVGTDRRSDVPTTGTSARAAAWIPGAQRSDTLMILHIDADRRGASLISIPRDTWVNVPGYGMNKINAAFSLSGPSLAIATVEALTSVRIDHLAVVDWSGFEALIDAVGGIDVTVPDTVTDSVRDITWTAGEHRLDGKQALDYVAQRHGLPLGDLNRVQRQQVVLRTLMQNALHQEMRKDPRMLYDFLDTVSQHLSVDSDWSTKEMVALVVSMRNFRSAGLIYLTMPVARFGTESGQSVVYAARQPSRGLWGAVITDDVESWAASHQDRLTPSIVS